MARTACRRPRVAGRIGARRLPDLELRLIGPLQSNKAKEAVALFDVIETLDREKLAGALADACAKAGRTPRLYVQVNTGEEDQKAGVAPHEADAFIASDAARLWFCDRGADVHSAGG